MGYILQHERPSHKGNAATLNIKIIAGGPASTCK
jgi:hypothetical protein